MMRDRFSFERIGGAPRPTELAPAATATPVRPE